MTGGQNQGHSPSQSCAPRPVLESPRGWSDLSLITPNRPGGIKETPHLLPTPFEMPSVHNSGRDGEGGSETGSTLSTRRAFVDPRRQGCLVGRTRHGHWCWHSPASCPATTFQPCEFRHQNNHCPLSQLTEFYHKPRLQDTLCIWCPSDLANLLLS